MQGLARGVEKAQTDKQKKIGKMKL